MATLKEIALEAGVSQATVSRVLNGDPAGVGEGLADQSGWRVARKSLPQGLTRRAVS